jgi:hypothetical protein
MKKFYVLKRGLDEYFVFFYLKNFWSEKYLPSPPNLDSEYFFLIFKIRRNEKVPVGTQIEMEYMEYFEFEEGYGTAKQVTFRVAKGWVAKLIACVLATADLLSSSLDISQKL